MWLCMTPTFPANADTPRHRGLAGPCSCRQDAQQVTGVQRMPSCPINPLTLVGTSINTLIIPCPYPFYGFTPLLTQQAIALQHALHGSRRGRCWRHACFGRRYPKTADLGGKGHHLRRERLVAHSPNPPRRYPTPPSHQSMFFV